MKFIKNLSFSIFCFSLFACITNHAQIFHSLIDFNIVEGNKFVSTLKNVQEIDKISSLDQAENEYRINDVIIFTELNKIHSSTRLNYKEYAKQNNIDENHLKNLIDAFEKMNVCEFYDNNDFFIFPVEKYALAKQKGYVFTENSKANVGNILTTTKGFVYGKKIILTKKIGNNWFQYESLK